MTKVAQSFLDLVKRSQLVEDDQLQEFLLDRLRKKHGGSLPEPHQAHAEAFVKAELITEWQAEKLLVWWKRSTKSLPQASVPFSPSAMSSLSRPIVAMLLTDYVIGGLAIDV